MEISWRRVRLALLAALAACAAMLVGVSSAAAAPRGSGYYVTFVARSCPEYTDIFANKARNNILESLKDLGPDAQQYYVDGGLINPDYEEIPPQDACSPVPNWQFTIGTGYQSRAVTGPWGSLSIVTGPYDTPIVTQDSTPLLNQNAQQIDNETLAGATTIELTDAQRQQASQPDQLWAQGGTPTDPVLATQYPGPEFGFGALRCATDDLNGDNVEYIYFPTGVTHVFCYGLYVKPSPTAGLITIKKEVSGAPQGEILVPVHRQHLLRPRRLPALERGLNRLLPGGRRDLECDRGDGRQLQAQLGSVLDGHSGRRSPREHHLGQWRHDLDHPGRR